MSPAIQKSIIDADNRDRQSYKLSMIKPTIMAVRDSTEKQGSCQKQIIIWMTDSLKSDYWFYDTT